MSDDGWPADPKDPRCPTCGEPVSATASYCMHCEADLPPAGFGEDASAATEPVDDAPVDEADPGMPTTDDRGAGTGDGDAGDVLDGVADGLLGGDDEDADAGEHLGGDAPDASGPPAADAPDASGRPVGDDGGSGDAAGPGDAPTPSPADEEPDHGGAWIDPNSLLDNVSTVAVGVGAGLVTIVLAALVTFWLLPEGFEGAAVWLGLAAGAGGGLWIARTRTVFGAARRAGYALGGLLALVPVAVSVALSWQDPGDAIGGAVVFGLFLWPVALVVVGLGWLLGKGGVDDGGE